jgi:hypothetical protein
MSLSQVHQADTHSQKRAWLMTIGAVVLLVLAAFAAVKIPREPVSLDRAAFWGLLILLWLLMLATGGGFLLNRKVRSLMNDEVSVHNRRRAVETGFWAAMAIALGLYFASLAWPIPLRAALAMLTEAAIACALLRYAWLERH